MTHGTIEQYIARKKREFPSFDPSALAPQFWPYFGTDTRIRVERTHDSVPLEECCRTRTGRVGITTGWRPVFLLIHRSSDHGSSYMLGRDDKIVAVQNRPGGPYLQV